MGCRHLQQAHEIANWNLTQKMNFCRLKACFAQPPFAPAVAPLGPATVTDAAASRDYNAGGLGRASFTN